MNRIWFTPYAYAKMIYMRDKQANEVSCMAITPNTLNIIEELYFPRQEVQSAYVDIDEDGLALMCDELAQKGLQPEQFMRIWIHTHPKSMGATPSGRDRQCMEESFSTPDWAIMMIFSQNGESFAELRMNKPFLMTQKLDIFVDYSSPFPASNKAEWDKEYEKNVKPFQHKATQYNAQNGYGYAWAGGSHIDIKNSCAEFAEKLMTDEKWVEEVVKKISRLAGEAFSKSKLTSNQVQAIVRLIAKIDPLQDPDWPSMYELYLAESDYHRPDMAATFAIMVPVVHKHNFTAGTFVKAAFDYKKAKDEAAGEEKTEKKPEEETATTVVLG